MADQKHRSKLLVRANLMKIKSIQRPGTEAIRRTKSQHSKPKRDINNITNSPKKREHMVNRVSSYFPKVSRSATETV